VLIFFISPADLFSPLGGSSLVKKPGIELVMALSLLRWLMQR